MQVFFKSDLEPRYLWKRKIGKLHLISLDTGKQRGIFQWFIISHLLNAQDSNNTPKKKKKDNQFYRLVN